MTHNLKIHPEYFTEIILGTKTFEVRKNDRDFKIGDTLYLLEYCPNKKEFTGDSCVRNVSCVFQGGSFGLDPEYVILGLKNVCDNKEHSQDLTEIYTLFKSLQLTGEDELIKQELLDGILGCIESGEIDKETLKLIKIKLKELLICLLNQM